MARLDRPLLPLLDTLTAVGMDWLVLELLEGIRQVSGAAFLMAGAPNERYVVNIVNGEIGPQLPGPKLAFDAWRIVRRGEKEKDEDDLCVSRTGMGDPGVRLPEGSRSDCILGDLLAEAFVR